jgi:hypothetical protein
MAARIGGAGGYQHWRKHNKLKTPMPCAIVVGAAPVVLDYCAASCAAQQALTRDGAQPACHHAATSSPRIGEKHTPVGLNHHGMTATVASNPVTPERSAGSVLTIGQTSDKAIQQSRDLRRRNQVSASWSSRNSARSFAATSRLDHAHLLNL